MNLRWLPVIGLLFSDNKNYNSKKHRVWKAYQMISVMVLIAILVVVLIIWQAGEGPEEF